MNRDFWTYEKNVDQPIPDPLKWWVMLSRPISFQKGFFWLFFPFFSKFFSSYNTHRLFLQNVKICGEFGSAF